MTIDLDQTVGDLIEEMPQEEPGAALMCFDASEDLLVFVVRGVMAQTMKDDLRALMHRFNHAEL